MDLPDVMPAGLSGAGLLGAVSSLYGPILPDLTQEAAFGLLMVFHWTGFFLSTAGAQPAAALTCLHSTWGVGAVAAGLGWRAAGGLVMLTAGAASLLILRWGLIHLEPGAPVAWHGLPWRALALPLAMFVVYVGTETALGGWATTFFVGLGQGPVVGALAMAFFFLTFTVGRLSLAAFTDWLGVAHGAIGDRAGSGFPRSDAFARPGLSGFRIERPGLQRGLPDHAGMDGAPLPAHPGADSQPVHRGRRLGRSLPALSDGLRRRTVGVRGAANHADRSLVDRLRRLVP